MHRKSSFGSFVPWETIFVTEHASSLREAGEVSFLPCHIQEATWMAGKQSASGRWITTNPPPWAFCQKGDVIDYALGSNQPLSVEDNRKKHHEDQDRTNFEAVRKESLRVHRSRLEYDVSRLEKRLQEELDLHLAYQNAHDHAMGVISSLPSHLPISAQKLLLDVATLEFAVAKLEQQMVSLHLQLVRERSEYGNVLPHQSHVPCGDGEPPAQDLSLSPTSQHSKSIAKGQPPSPATPATPAIQESLCDHSSGMSSTETNLNVDTELVEEAASLQRYSSEDVLTEESRSGSLEYMHRRSSDEECDWQSRQGTSFQAWESRHPSDDPNNPKDVPAEDIAPEALLSGKLWQSPNELSEQMVQCMVDIYYHLSDRSVPAQGSLMRDMPSPRSPFGHLVSSSLSSVSESSFISFARSPLVDLRSKGGALAYDNVFDPYRTEEKLLTPDLGAYKGAVEVSWMSVGRKQLDYAAEALQKFKTLVEHLSRVDPSNMRHAEKLAFWINVYNALMMHAFLAYGTPDSEAKFFSLMQKANYVVGGHSFNAITIEYALLKNRASTYRPQLELLLALKDVDLSEQQQKFGITHEEPLSLFALSFGAWSSPAVRVYRPNNIHEQLEASLRDYLQSSIGISRKSGKLMVPKLLYVHFRETQGRDLSLFSWINHHLSEAQRAVLQDQMQQKKRHQHSLIQVLPFEFRFRYLFLLSDGIDPS